MLLALRKVCSIVNEVRAPRLAAYDQPSPSKPVIPNWLQYSIKAAFWQGFQPRVWATEPDPSRFGHLMVHFGSCALAGAAAKMPGARRLLKQPSKEFHRDTNAG